MYRQYEDPRKLEQMLEEEVHRMEIRIAEGEEVDDADWERIADLQDRVNFAWQDEEADEWAEWVEQRY